MGGGDGGETIIVAAREGRGCGERRNAALVRLEGFHNSSESWVQCVTFPSTAPRTPDRKKCRGVEEVGGEGGYDIKTVRQRQKRTVATT